MTVGITENTIESVTLNTSWQYPEMDLQAATNLVKY